MFTELGICKIDIDIIVAHPSNHSGLHLVWNTHSRISKEIAQAHIAEWSALSPPVTANTPTHPGPIDLDTPDELALRVLLLGIAHRSAGDFTSSRSFLTDAYDRRAAVTVSTWIAGVAMFELAVLDLKEVDANQAEKETWIKALSAASGKLDQAMSLATSSTDLSSRLDSRIAMLRDEIATKREMLGIV